MNFISSKSIYENEYVRSNVNSFWRALPEECAWHQQVKERSTVCSLHDYTDLEECEKTISLGGELRWSIKRKARRRGGGSSVISLCVAEL